MSSPADEQHLLDLLQSGDQRTAEQIFNMYAARLLELARHRIGKQLSRRIDPEDVVQSVFRTFFRRAQEKRFVLEELDDVSRLLVGITVRKTLRQIGFQKAAKRDPNLEQHNDSLSGAEAPELCTLEPSPDAAVAFIDHLEHFLSQLRPVDRSIVEQRLEGCSTTEIADKLQLSDRHVRRVLQHVRAIAEQEDLS